MAAENESMAGTAEAAAATADGARGEPVTARDVAEWLRERIRRGRYVPGQRLIEAELSRQTGASRSRVREAIQRLATEGLLTLEEFRGASVRHVTASEMREIYRARMALEGMAARDFAASDDAERKARLLELQSELNACERTGNHETFARLNDAWHLLIVEGAQNSYIAGFLDRLRVPLYRLLFTTFYNADRIDSANAGHRRITAAITDGRADDAERLMRDHIEEGLHAAQALEDAFDR